MPSDVALFALFVFGLGGALIGVAFLGTVENARPIFLPMIIPFLYLLTTEDPTDVEVSKTLSWLSLIATAYTAMNALVNLQVLPGLLAFKQYRNASVAMVALAVATAIVLGNRRRLLLVLALAAVIFVTYPSATSVLVGASVVLTFYLTGKRSSGLRTLVVTGTIVTVAVLSLVNFDRGVQIADRYFAAVDKANANSGRLDLWSEGLERWREAPIFGSGFAGETTAVRSRDERALPFHNDFVLFLANGGLVGIGLLLSWFVLTELTLIRRYRGFVRAGDMRRAGLLRAILVCLNAFIVAMGFNPVLPGASRSATIFGLYAIAMSIGQPAAVTDEVAPVTERERVAPSA
jgi:O-antigen ligase